MMNLKFAGSFIRALRLIKLSITRYKPTKDHEIFYLNGFLNKKLINGSQDDVVTWMKSCSKGDLPEGAYFEEKRKAYFILRGDEELQSCFLDFLFKNNIPELLCQLSGESLHLGFFAIIKHLPGIKVNLDWHRDTHFIEHQQVGPLPRAIKVYFYPSFGENKAPRIEFFVGSHRIDFQNIFTNWIVRSFGVKKKISSSDEYITIFDSTTAHRVIPDKVSQGSMRLVYVFYHSSQQAKLRHPDHLKLQDEFARRARNTLS